jgi:hypothetical protein
VLLGCAVGRDIEPYPRMVDRQFLFHGDHVFPTSHTDRPVVFGLSPDPIKNERVRSFLFLQCYISHCPLPIFISSALCLVHAYIPDAEILRVYHNLQIG